MTSNSNHNLSFAIKIPTTTVQSESLVRAVDKTLNKFFVEKLFEDYLNLYNVCKGLRLKKDSSIRIQSERVILCEINAGLWVKAFTSAINSLTDKTCPHHFVTQNFIHYLLNASSDAEFGLVNEYFCKLLMTFPPGPQSFDYYWPVVSESLLIPYTKKSGESGLFFWLLDILTTCLKNQKISHVDFRSTQGRTSVMPNTTKSLYTEEKMLEVIDNFNRINLNKSLVMKKQKENSNAFFELSDDRKIRNILLVLNFLYDVLEADFGFWMSLHNFSQKRRPLLSCLLWENERDIGINTEVRKILKLYKVVLQLPPQQFQKLFVINKLVNLLGEVLRCKDITEEVKYPFFGIHSNNFARQISQIILEYLQELRSKHELPNENCSFLNLKPPWLRLLLCSYLLSALTGYQCLPELTGAYDILENIAHSENAVKKSFKRTKITKIPEKSKLIQELKNYKSINARVKNGKTLLHVACEDDNVQKVQALLTFPELDVNATDREGWTALHLAAYKGNSSCVRQLLTFNPKSGDVRKRVNTRALGPQSVTPLMCAVSAGHVDVCRLLLEHTGSVLLEDFNELNQTPLELSQKMEVTEILKQYKNNYVWTWHSQKDINFDLDVKEIIIRLCVEMVQAYFSTHRTWDVYRTLKKSEDLVEDSLELPNSENKCKWDYLRYQRDIKRNIYKLRRLIPQLEKVYEFKSSNQIYIRLLTFNKT